MTSTKNSGAADGGAIDARVQTVQRQVSRLEAALNASRKSRQLILSGLIVLIVVVSYLFYGLANQLRSEEYITSLSAEAQNYANDNADSYMREVRTLTDNVTPVITKAFYQQAKRDAPKLTLALNKERELLMKNVQARLEKQINDQYATVLADYEKILITEFPKAEDDIIRRRVMANFRVAMNRMVKRFYADQFQQELQSMYDTWDEFPIADAAEEGDVPLEDQLVGYLIEVMTLKASGKGQLIVADRRSSSPAGTETVDDISTADPDSVTEPARPAAAEKSSSDSKAPQRSTDEVGAEAEKEASPTKDGDSAGPPAEPEKTPANPE